MAVVLVGGSLVSDAMVDEVLELLGGLRRLAGQDRELEVLEDDLVLLIISPRSVRAGEREREESAIGRKESERLVGEAEGETGEGSDRYSQRVTTGEEERLVGLGRSHGRRVGDHQHLRRGQQSASR